MELMYAVNPRNKHTTTRVVFVIHEASTINIFKKGLFKETFTSEFYGSKDWPARANSTARLTLANCQALDSLPNSISVEIWGGFDLNQDFLNAIQDSDILVVNQIASVKSFEFLNEITSLAKEGKIGCKLIFGTEGTWQSLIKNEQMTEDDIHYLFMNHLVLRHTARTDRFVYDNNDRYLNANVQEFELGINTEVITSFHSENGHVARNKILFVKAPEGRKTKNNELVAEFTRAIELDSRISHLEVFILEPPYSALDYWKLSEQTKYVIFTSIGETFSYVYNDARAAGVIGFMPSQMYLNMLGKRFATDSYPEIGIRYTDINEVLDTIYELETDKEKYSNETQSSITTTQSNFDIGSITSKWNSLFTGKSLNSNKLLILGAGEASLPEAKIFEIMDFHGAKYVLSIQNQSVISPKPGNLSRRFPNGKISLSDWAESTDGELLRSLGVDERGWLSATSRPSLRKIDALDNLQFYRLLVRINKIGTLVIAPDTTSPSFISDLGQLLIYGGIHEGMKAIEVEPLDVSSIAGA